MISEIIVFILAKFFEPQIDGWGSRLAHAGFLVIVAGVSGVIVVKGLAAIGIGISPEPNEIAVWAIVRSPWWFMVALFSLWFWRRRRLKPPAGRR